MANDAKSLKYICTARNILKTVLLSVCVTYYVQGVPFGCALTCVDIKLRVLPKYV